MQFLKWEVIKSKRGTGFFWILLLLFIFTITCFYGVKFMASDYARAGMRIDNETINDLYYYFGYTPTGRSSAGIAIAVENLSVDFILPIILGSFFAGKFYENRKSKSYFVEMNESGHWRYYLNYIVSMTACVAGFLFLAFLTQGAIGYWVDQLLKPRGYALPISLGGVSAIVASAMRISVFYGLTVMIALTISAVFPFIKRLVYVIPLLIVLVTEVMIKPTQPLKEAFITSGRAIQLKSFYYVSILVMILAGIFLLAIVRTVRKDEL